MKKQAIAIIEATVGIPIVVTQRLVQWLSDSQALNLRQVKQQMTTALVVGKLALQFGSREFNKAIRCVAATEAEVAPRDQPTKLDHQAEPQGKLPDLAIANYESFNASEIVARLDSLDVGDLHEIAAFEKANRMRQTILFKIAKLLHTQ